MPDSSRSSNLTLGAGVFGRQGEIPGDDEFVVQHLDYRNQLSSKLFQSRVVEILGYDVESVRDTFQRPPTGRAQLRHQGVLDVGRRRRHGIELVQEAIDGGRLLRRVGDVVAHQFLCLAHGFVPELQTKLTAQLCPQQFSLAPTLCLDALRVDLGLGRELFGNPFRVALASSTTRSASDLAASTALLWAVVDSVSRSAAVAESSSCWRTVILPSCHQITHWRHDIAHHQKHDGREPDQLSNKRRHR